jgi:hypothetical protein
MARFFVAWKLWLSIHEFAGMPVFAVIAKTIYD